MSSAQGSSLCSTSVDKKDDHVCSLLVQNSLLQFNTKFSPPLMAQGYGVTQNLLLQNDKSSILLERNGKASSGKRTRHINIRYFFITDRGNMKEIEIK
jgi:hypothetical protein